jgi:hypothetical protein
MYLCLLLERIQHTPPCREEYMRGEGGREARLWGELAQYGLNTLGKLEMNLEKQAGQIL